MKNGHLIKGFSLIELCITLTIGAFITAAGISVWSAQLEKTKVVTTRDKMASIERALETYVARTGILPCPASRTAAFGQAAFGEPTDCNVTTVNAGTCANGICVQNGRLYDHDNNPATAEVPLRVRIGAIPTRVLNLPFDVTKDGYNRNFTYAVTEKMAVPPAPGSSIPAGAISIVDDSGNSAINPAGEAAYIIISHGADGKGATDFISGQEVASCDTGASAGRDSQNCALAASGALFRVSLYSSSYGTNHFDDMLTYAAQVKPAAGTPTAAAAGSSFTSITLWGMTTCPNGWVKASHEARRFEIMGPGGNGKEPQCISNLERKWAQNKKALTPYNDSYGMGYYVNYFDYEHTAAIAHIVPIDTDCVVCVPEVD